MARVLVDTNVLYPFSVMDLVLALTEDGIHEVIWTEDLLAEWAAVMVRAGKRSPAAAASITAAIRTYFHECEIPRQDYEALIADMPGNDPADRVHMAAAIAGGAKTIITKNLRDFPAAPLRDRGVEVIEPDAYLCGLLDEWPDEVTATLVRLAAEKQNPPKTPTDLLNDLDHAGVPRFAAHVHQLLAAR